MTPMSSKIHSTFGVKITLKRELNYRSKKYSQIGVDWGLFFLLHFWSQIYSLKITVKGTGECQRNPYKQSIGSGKKPGGVRTGYLTQSLRLYRRAGY